jgi:hypothetical protein
MKQVWTALALVALAGCGAAARTVTRSKLQIARATHEYPSPRPPRESVSAGSVSAELAVRRFATAYINWTADSVAADMRALAARSVGQARSALELAAAQTASDYELRRGGIANSGTVETIAPLLGARNRYVVVTRESTTATNTTAYDGLRPAWHVSIAMVTPVGGRWVVSGWEPQS